MNDFKPGDLAMTVRLKRCCGGGSLGWVFTVGSAPFRTESVCRDCGSIYESLAVTTEDDPGLVVEVARIKKIDPPAEGDSLPTRRDLEVAA